MRIIHHIEALKSIKLRTLRVGKSIKKMAVNFSLVNWMAIKNLTSELWWKSHTNSSSSHRWRRPGEMNELRVLLINYIIQSWQATSGRTSETLFIIAHLLRLHFVFDVFLSFEWDSSPTTKVFDWNSFSQLLHFMRFFFFRCVAELPFFPPSTSSQKNSCWVVNSP